MGWDVAEEGIGQEVGSMMTDGGQQKDNYLSRHGKDPK